MNSAVWIFLLAAMVGTVGFVWAESWLRQCGLIKPPQPLRTPAELRDIRMAIEADIEVYDFVDGVEVNRRPAYPMARLSRGIDEATATLIQLGDAFEDVIKQLSAIGGTRKVSMFTEAASRALAAGPW